MRIIPVTTLSPSFVFRCFTREAEWGTSLLTGLMFSRFSHYFLVQCSMRLTFICILYSCLQVIEERWCCLPGTMQLSRCRKDSIIIRTWLAHLLSWSRRYRSFNIEEKVHRMCRLLRTVTHVYVFTRPWKTLKNKSLLANVEVMALQNIWLNTMEDTRSH